jgi:hypothetical protein
MRLLTYSRYVVEFQMVLTQDAPPALASVWEARIARLTARSSGVWACPCADTKEEEEEVEEEEEEEVEEEEEEEAQAATEAECGAREMRKST